MTNDELRDERERRGLTQSEMAKLLEDTPLSTYRKWEQGVRRVPGWIASHLAGTKMEIPSLTIDEIDALDQRARKEGKTMTQLIGEMIRDGLKRGMILMVLVAVGAASFHLFS